MFPRNAPDGRRFEQVCTIEPTAHQLLSLLTTKAPSQISNESDQYQRNRTSGIENVFAARGVFCITNRTCTSGVVAHAAARVPRRSCRKASPDVRTLPTRHLLLAGDICRTEFVRSSPCNHLSSLPCREIGVLGRELRQAGRLSVENALCSVPSSSS